MHSANIGCPHNAEKEEDHSSTSKMKRHDVIVFVTCEAMSLKLDKKD